MDLRAQGVGVVSVQAVHVEQAPRVRVTVLVTDGAGTPGVRVISAESRVTSASVRQLLRTRAMPERAWTPGVTRSLMTAFEEVTRAHAYQHQNTSHRQGQDTAEAVPGARSTVPSAGATVCMGASPSGGCGSAVLMG